ncbi:DUF2849 domain-containing protein [Aquibium sp. A9E412]|uniref:DUF2849 domain-containing protein n=1 Tax=Aquibium sp. A9E412 TaxID=2976767 RepID=UPI0025B2790B|nr:DUF2849 domain-containing protein [Aquibium sp. A9E412]MDN2567074.1 DUF2849 domain-containing protein [Aquibium sp. A9E412]
MQILTANRLLDGEAVWLGPDRLWHETIAAAEVAHDAAAAARLEETGRAALAASHVVDVALVDVELVDGRPWPKRLRERIRAAGPTTRTDLGKQARPATARAA